jgi:hypothetical protein
LPSAEVADEQTIAALAAQKHRQKRGLSSQKRPIVYHGYVSKETYCVSRLCVKRDLLYITVTCQKRPTVYIAAAEIAMAALADQKNRQQKEAYHPHKKLNFRQK